MHVRKSALAILLLVLIIPVRGQRQYADTIPDSYLMDLSLNELLNIKVKVSSTKSDDVFSAPSTVSIITDEMIRKYHYQSIPEALASIPGIDVLQTIIDRNVTTPRGILQNFYANKILILINNIPTWQPIYGTGQLERIQINDVERIEVLKGPASVLYGSNAYAAVINIILRSPEHHDLSMHGSAGYPRLEEAGFSFNYKGKTWKNRLSIHSSSESRKPYEVLAARGHDYNGDSTFRYSERYILRTVTNELSYESHALLVNFFEYDHTFMGEHPSYAGGGGTLVENMGFLANYRFEKVLTDRVHVWSNLTYDYFKREFPLSADRTQLIRLAGSRQSLETRLNFKLNKVFALEVGLMGENRVSHGHNTVYALTDSLIRSNLTQDDNIPEGSFFSQLSMNFSKIQLLLGGRYTYNSLFGDNFSFRGTANYRINKSNSVKLIAGQSFRVPTMFELYFDHRTVRGNTNLHPETSNSVELAYVTTFRKFYVQTLFYYSQYKNLIQRIALPDAAGMYQNASDFEGYGLETEVSYRNYPLGEFFLNYNWVAGSGDENYPNYKYVPDHTLSLGINKPVGAFNFYMSGRVISETMGAVSPIPVQYFINAGMGYFHEVKSMKILYKFSIKNLTDSDFETPEYIRRTPNINSLPTLGYGRRFIFSIQINY